MRKIESEIVKSILKDETLRGLVSKLPNNAEIIETLIYESMAVGHLEYGSLKAKIFLTYAREDVEQVKRLYERLNFEGFTPWMDVEDLLPGQDWSFEVENTIRTSDFNIVCLSKNSISKKGYVAKEITTALEIYQRSSSERIYLIPLRLEECEVPKSLEKIQWLDLFEENGFSKLIKTLQAQIQKERTAV